MRHAHTEAFGVQLKLVVPGYGPITNFTANGGARMAGLIPEAYAPFAEKVFAGFAQPSAVSGGGVCGGVGASAISLASSADE